MCWFRVRIDAGMDVAVFEGRYSKSSSSVEESEDMLSKRIKSLRGLVLVGAGRRFSFFLFCL